MMDMDEAGGWLSLIEVNVYLKDPSRTVGNFPVRPGCVCEVIVLIDGEHTIDVLAVIL
jgi:hypothetical protein